MGRSLIVSRRQTLGDSPMLAVTHHLQTEQSVCGCVCGCGLPLGKLFVCSEHHVGVTQIIVQSLAPTKQEQRYGV